MPHTASAIETFKVQVPDTALQELQHRLACARLPETETVSADKTADPQWAQGVPRAVLSDVVDYWRIGYDWRLFEHRLHQIGQYRVLIDDLPIHFLHRRSSRSDAVPLLLTHGWPGSVAEFIDILDELADPKDIGAPAFHVVAPSLPGFGFSGKPTISGWGTEKIAAAWVSLMERMGHSRFLAHGGDWGGVITTILGARFPGQCAVSTPRSLTLRRVPTWTS